MCKNALITLRRGSHWGPTRSYPASKKKKKRKTKSESVKSLSFMFNKSLQSSIMPDEQQLGNVTPIYQKGDKFLPSNYRPISLTSVACRILETLIREKLVNRLKENKLIKKHSTRLP